MSSTRTFGRPTAPKKPKKYREFLNCLLLITPTEAGTWENDKGEQVAYTDADVLEVGHDASLTDHENVRFWGICGGQLADHVGEQLLVRMIGVGQGFELYEPTPKEEALAASALSASADGEII